MKLLFITTDVNVNSGWGVVSLNTIKYFSKNTSHEISVITLKDSINEPLPRVTYFPVLTTISDRKLKVTLLFIDFLKFLLKKGGFSYDYVHVLAEPFLPIVNFFPFAKKYLTIHGTYAISSFSKLNKYYRTYFTSLFKVSKVFAVSDFTKNKFIDNIKQNSSVDIDIDVDVITLGVNYINLEPNFSKENSICFVGHIKERKGLYILLKSINYLIDKCNFKDLMLYIVGSDLNDKHAHSDYLRKCLKFINDNNLSNHVVFTGQVSESDLNKIYKNSKINVLPSINADTSFEGFGLVHLEANINGTPSIGSLNCGNESAIKHEFSGFLVKQNDYIELSNCIRSILLLDDEEYFNLSNNSRNYALNNLWDNYGITLSGYYY